LPHNADIYGDLDRNFNTAHNTVNNRNYDTVNVRNHDPYHHSIADGHAKHTTHARAIAFAFRTANSKPVGGADVAADQVTIFLAHCATHGLSFYVTHF